MDILKVFGTDAAKEVEGVKHPMGTGYVVVARWMNARHEEMNRIAKAARELEMELEKDPVKLRQIRLEYNAEAMAQSVLVGFEGLTYGGEALPYSVENAKKLLLIKDFQDAIFGLSIERAHYAAKVKEEAAKNS